MERVSNCPLADNRGTERNVSFSKKWLCHFFELFAEFSEECDQYGDEPHHSEDAEHSLPRDEQRDLKICHIVFLLNP